MPVVTYRNRLGIAHPESNAIGSERNQITHYKPHLPESRQDSSPGTERDPGGNAIWRLIGIARRERNGIRARAQFDQLL